MSPIVSQPHAHLLQRSPLDTKGTTGHQSKCCAYSPQLPRSKSSLHDRSGTNSRRSFQHRLQYPDVLTCRMGAIASQPRIHPSSRLANASPSQLRTKTRVTENGHCLAKRHQQSSSTHTKILLPALWRLSLPCSGSRAIRISEGGYPMPNNVLRESRLLPSFWPVEHLLEGPRKMDGTLCERQFRSNFLCPTVVLHQKKGCGESGVPSHLYQPTLSKLIQNLLLLLARQGAQSLHIVRGRGADVGWGHLPPQQTPNYYGADSHPGCKAPPSLIPTGTSFH